MVLFVAAALIVAGFLVWRKQRWVWLLTAILATKARQDRLAAESGVDSAP